MSDVRDRPKARSAERTETMALNIRKIGVVGAGQMGSGIAHVCALAGLNVLLNDVSADRIKAGMATINGNMARQVSRKRISEDERQAALKRIAPADTFDAFGDCDLVLEAATEKEDVKRSIFANLCASLKPEAIVGSNTSSISITRLASATDRPERFIGIHFMNPVPLMELVEVIRGIATDDQTFEATKQFITKLGKTIAVAEDFPAFIVNRILMPMINEAIYTLYEGVGNVEGIDTAMRLGAHHPMGPLELADFIGLDTCLSVMQVLHDGLADSKYRPCPLLVKYVEAGWLGRKTQRGFTTTAARSRCRRAERGRVAASSRTRARSLVRPGTCAAARLHHDRGLEAAPDHALAVERHRLRIHHLRQPRVAHDLLEHAIAMRARFVEDVGKHHDFVFLELHALRK